MIRDAIKKTGLWTSLTEQCLIYQIHCEYGFEPHGLLSNRHACPTEWTGEPAANCEDPICFAELPQDQFDNIMAHGYGLKHTCEYMEAKYWLLRAYRRNHPSVQDVNKRILGHGFEGVNKKDKRVFRRGEGWDGYQTGMMEVEAANWHIQDPITVAAPNGQMQVIKFPPKLTAEPPRFGQGNAGVVPGGVQFLPHGGFAY